MADTTTAQPSGWTGGRIAAAVALVAAGVFVTLDAWVDNARIAILDEEASHVLLVLPIVAILVLVRRQRLLEYRPYCDPAGPLIIAIGWLMSWYGFNYMTQAAWHLGAVVIAIGCVTTMFGRGLLWRLKPAVAVLLLFSIPIPGMLRAQVAIPMQTVTAALGQAGSLMVGMQVERSTNLLIYQGQAINIAEGCNGMRMIFALLLVSIAFAFIYPLRGYVRAIVILLAPVLAIVANVLRIVPTIAVYGAWGDEIGKAFHDYAGWAMLIVAWFVLQGTVSVLQWAQVPVMRPASKPEPKRAQATATPPASTPARVSDKHAATVGGPQP